jgi:uridine kinase/dihydrodipicolinate synthase/N-acetylneuraminate lyase
MEKHYKIHITPKEYGRSRYSPEILIAELISTKFEYSRRPVVIAIGGAGGIGKSSFSERLRNALSDSVILHLDNYKTPRTLRQSKNVYGAHPDANYMELIIEHLQAIRENKSFNTPLYDVVNGTSDKTELFTPQKFVLLDGEVSTYADFYKWVDFSIFIDSDWKTQLQTRVTRDITVRKYSQEKAIATFLQSNLREFQEYGIESKKWADIHLFCREDYSLIIESVEQKFYDDFTDLFDNSVARVDIEGVIVPVVTPFDQNNKVDTVAFVKHLKFLEDNGVHRILLGSIWGENTSLLPEERKLLLVLAREYFPGVILLQITDNSLEQGKKEARLANEYGADGVVSTLPDCLPFITYQEEINNYLDVLEQSSSLPLLTFDKKELIFTAREREEKFSCDASSLFDGDNNKLIGVIVKEGNCLPDYYANLECTVEMAAREELSELKESTEKLHRFFSETQSPIALLKYGISLSIKGYPTNVRLPLSNKIEHKRIEKMKLFI